MIYSQACHIWWERRNLRETSIRAVSVHCTRIKIPVRPVVVSQTTWGSSGRFGKTGNQ